MRLNPTILTNDKDDYIKQVVRDAKFAKELDIDIINWSLTPGKTLTAQESLDVPVEVRLNFDLMMDKPSEAVKILIKDHRVGKIIINLHSRENVFELVDLVKNAEKKPAVSFHDREQYDEIKDYFTLVDAIHVFAIQPGAQGNTFRPEILEFANKLREDGFDGEIGLDGGVNSSTLPIIVNYPFDLAVVGSAISKSETPKAEYLKLLELERQLRTLA